MKKFTSFLLCTSFFLAPLLVAGEAPHVIQIVENKNTFVQLVQADQETIEIYESFSEELKKKLPKNDAAQVHKALIFAAKRHEGQFRKNPKHNPYIIHPLRVAKLLLTTGGVNDPNILMGALLHDTVEDTKTTFEEIQENFGQTVVGYVREVTDDKTLPREQQLQLQLKNAPHKSRGAALIKLGDKTDNISDLLENPPLNWSEEKKANYLNWCQKIVEALPPVSSSLNHKFDQILSQHVN